jgi:hypothetical protein
LVHWRRYSHVGYSEIERARDEFLALPGADPQEVEREYRAVKAEERAKRRAEMKWYERNGLAGLKAKMQRASIAQDQAARIPLSYHRQLLSVRLRFSR